MVAKPFPRKQIYTKIFINNFLFENVLWLQNQLIGNGSFKNFSWKPYSRKIFKVAKSFPRKQVYTKHFHQNVLVENFYGCKIISLKTGFDLKFSSNIFLLKIFYGYKIIFSKTGFNPKNVLQSYFGRTFFDCKIISSEIG